MALNTLLILALLLLYVLPISLGIWIITWLLGKYNSKKRARTVRKVLFSLLGIAFVGIIIYDYAQTRHRMRFELDERYELQVFMYELESFLDWPIEVEVIAVDLVSGQKLETAFQNDGPYFQFLTDQEGRIWMKGYGESLGIDWTFDFQKQEVSYDAPKKEEDFSFQKQV